jgi:8-oxo-dGTP diphosphatase
MTDNLQLEIARKYGNKIRVRVCGCLLKDGKLLMLRHNGIGPQGYYWNVPGGEPENGENLENALLREFLEETHLKVKIEKLLCQREFIQPPLHAIEFYFKVNYLEGKSKLGSDPENVEILSELKWFSASDFEKINPDSRPDFLKSFIKID